MNAIEKLNYYTRAIIGLLHSFNNVTNLVGSSTTKTQHQVQRRLLLDVVIAEGATVLELLSSKDETLLIRGDSFFILNLGLHIVNRVGSLDIESNRLARQRLHKDLHSTPKSKDEVKRTLFLNVVVAEGTAIFELLARKDQTLLVRRNAFLCRTTKAVSL